MKSQISTTEVKLNFLLKSGAGKDTEGQLERRGGQRPGGDTARWKAGGKGQDRSGREMSTRVYCMLTGFDYFSHSWNFVMLGSLPSNLLPLLGNNR